MSGIITSTDIQNLKKVATPREVADLLGLEQKRMGRRVSILCPEHDDRHHGSCYLTEQGYKCFSCGKSGDIIKMVQAVHNCEFKDAVTYLCAAFGIKLNESEQTKPLSLVDKETLEFLGIVSRPNETFGYAVERVVGVVDENYPADELPKGYRLEWHPFSSHDVGTSLYESFETSARGPRGYCYVKEVIETNPLRVLYEENEDLYHSLIYNKASEKLAVFKEMKMWVIEHLPATDTRNAFLQALICNCKVCNRLMVEHGPCQNHGSKPTKKTKYLGNCQNGA